MRVFSDKVPEKYSRGSKLEADNHLGEEIVLSKTQIGLSLQPAEGQKVDASLK